MVPFHCDQLQRCAWQIVSVVLYFVSPPSFVSVSSQNIKNPFLCPWAQTISFNATVAKQQTLHDVQWARMMRIEENMLDCGQCCYSSAAASW
jgi:hypothetical protein